MSVRFPLLFFLFLYLQSCSPKEPTVFPVNEHLSESVFASGLIKAKNQYRAFANTSGIVKELYAIEGDLVLQGDVILEITNETARLNREVAQLARSFADRAKNLEKLKDLEINIVLAKARHDNDSILLERQKNLWTQGIGTAIELEQKQLNFENSKTALNSSQLKYTELNREIEFNERNARKNLEISQVLESDNFLKSKIDGKVYAILLEEGEMVSPQTPLAIIGSANEFILEMQVDEYDIVKINLGQQILVTMDSYRGEVFEAKVSKINPMKDELTKSFTVEAVFVKQPETLYPNLNFEANILIQTKEDALTIPRSFLLNDQYVITSKGDTLHVQVGLKGYRKVEILSGISSDTEIRKP